MRLVHNKANTANLNCSCGSWLSHWEAFHQGKSEFCSFYGCFSTDLEGAHVHLIPDDNQVYIIPLCHAHNMTEGDMRFYEDVELVSANKQETCEKK